MSISKNETSLWHVNSIRITGFPNPDYSSDPKWWDQVTDSFPDSINQQPKISAVSVGGNYKDINLTLGIMPFRFDWLINPKQNELTNNFLGIGTIETSYAIVDELMKKWVSKTNTLILDRIAVAGTFVLDVESKEDGYEILSKYLKELNIDWKNSSDLIYQINKPREIKLFDKEMRINRLTTWGVTGFKVTLIQPQIKNIESFQPVDFAIKLDFDINTSEEINGKFNQKEFLEVIKIFLNIAKEVTEKGNNQ
jgi:hypothetical protein